MIRHLIIALLFFSSCHSNDKGGCDNGELVTLKDFTGLDGCSWMLVKKDNSSLEPMNLPDFINKPIEGDTYIIEYRMRNDLASVCLAGSIIEITCVQKQ